MKTHTTQGSVLDDLGFEPGEAENLKIKAALMRAIEAEINQRKLTQIAAARILEVAQPRLSNLKRGKIHLFTIDCLIGMLSRLGKSVKLVIDDSLAA